MKLGLFLPQYGSWAKPQDVPEFARTVEAMGYDVLWVGDRLLTPTHPSDLYPAEPKPYPPEFTNAADPLSILAAAAAATSKIRLGSSTLTAPWYNPALLARALTTLDAVSSGRLDVGVGTSWMRDEYAVAGVEWESRGARLDEILDFLHVWWTTNPVKFDGNFIKVPESHVDLRPCQSGGPPIYLAGMSDIAMRRVGRRADGFLALAGIPNEVQAHWWTVACRSAEAAGRDSDEIKRAIRINVYEPDVADLLRQIDEFDSQGYDCAVLDLAFGVSSISDAFRIAEQLCASETR